jgi:DNA-binding beta-propeller fold protein YncE
MNRWRQLLIGAIPIVACTAPLAAQASKASAKAAGPQGPTFEVDMLWPKPMANRWILGSVTGLAIDSRDHVFVLTIPDYFTARTEIGSSTNPPTGECCSAAPAVLEYDAGGAVVGHWGGTGQGAEWPTTASGLAIDPHGDIWIGGSGGNDTRIFKFSRDGKFITAIGKSVAAPAAAGAPAGDTAYAGVSRGAAAGGRGGRGGARGGRGRGGQPALPANNASLEAFGGATRISFDAASNQAFIADGSRNHRVAVVDIATGAIKSVFGAYGNKPDDAAQPAYAPSEQPSKQFGAVSCAEVSKDGMVYVCDRTNDRIQVFKTNGTFVKEKVIAPSTLGGGSVWDVAFSRDAPQKYLYVADGMNQKIWVLDRQSLEPIASFGDGGRQPGEFYAPHSLAVDSKGNLYTGETFEGKRVQKFDYKGIGSVKMNEGVLWPRAAAAGGKP